MAAFPDLSHIEVNNETNPFILFHEWYNEARSKLIFEMLNTMNLATVSRDGVVTNRTVVCQEIEDDGFLFNTDKFGRKNQEIEHHPQVSITFYWCYRFDGKQRQKQVRIEGTAKRMAQSDVERQFAVAPMFCKVRNSICTQGKEVNWDELNDRYNSLKKIVLENNYTITIKDNPNLTVFKIVPYRMEFWMSHIDAIADRVVFIKASDSDIWNFKRLEP